MDKLNNLQWCWFKNFMKNVPENTFWPWHTDFLRPRLNYYENLISLFWKICFIRKRISDWNRGFSTPFWDITEKNPSLVKNLVGEVSDKDTTTNLLKLPIPFVSTYFSRICTWFHFDPPSTSGFYYYYYYYYFPRICLL